MCLRYSIVKRNKKERKKNDVNKSGLKISTKKNNIHSQTSTPILTRMENMNYAWESEMFTNGTVSDGKGKHGMSFKSKITMEFGSWFLEARADCGRQILKYHTHHTVRRRNLIKKKT